uniref:C2H2-type domain-containing protein n=1 Tax=Branchiostoma floridae TaxID=7739 RepID=C3ZD40_BRAFL|eukprot:XP_002593540.1 hypothetical protein BRAFLDRAFT_88525 [Branchiostoma floridae]
MSVHSVDRPHKCPQCPASFKRKDQLKFHQRIHSGFRPYQCKLCEKTFYHSGSYNEHVKVHTGTKAHQCRFCSKGFTSRNNMLRHQELHSTEGRYKIAYKCKECKAKFPSRKMVSLHQKQEHGDKKCFVCGEMCKGGREGLIEHTRFLHSGEKKRLSDGNNASGSQQGVVYQCTMCESVFDVRADLVEHVKTHANDPILKCPYCQERHRGTYKLNVHMNMHAGQRMMVPKLDTSSGAIVIVMPGQDQESGSLKAAGPVEETTSENSAAEKVVPEGGKVCVLGDVPESIDKEEVPTAGGEGTMLGTDSADGSVQDQASSSSTNKARQSKARPAKGTVAEKLGQLRSQNGDNRNVEETPVTGRRGRGRGRSRGRGRRSSRPPLPGYRPILPSSLMNPPKTPQQPIIILQSAAGVSGVGQPVMLTVPPASPGGVVIMPRQQVGGLTLPQQAGHVVLTAKPGQ